MSRRNVPIPTVLRSPVTLSIASLAASFVAAYQLDDLLHRLRLYAGTTFHFQPFVLLSALTPVLVVSVVLVLARFVLTRVPPTPAVPVIYLVAGLFIILEYVAYLVPIPEWLRLSAFGWLSTRLLVFGSLGSQSSTYYVASGSIVIAIAKLARNASQSLEAPSSSHSAA